MEVAWYKIRKKREDVSLFGIHIQGSAMETSSNYWRHPGNLTPVHWDTNSVVSRISIFTDGSKINGQVGAAFSVSSPFGTEEHQYRLDDHCSVFQAEAVAIQQALTWKKQNFPQDHCHLYSDSMSVLMSLQNHQIIKSIIQETRDLLDSTVSLHWVKAHIGVAGNEAADRAAKAAAGKEAIDIHLGLPERSITQILKSSLLKQWQQNWERDEVDDKASHSKNIFPDVARTRCISNPYDIQIATNHGLCPFYLRRFNLRNCSCRCGENVEDDVMHYVTKCPLLAYLRKYLKGNSTPLQILSTPALREEMRKILRFVYNNESNIFQTD
ncbi:hypothetical protein AVEN_235978-1 [Araneus ventricosus]|uniref:RNase H type-1 domain-containing protein n=1 Tax=Araneus ventricosus TaxID=182803 RepID=A0A4Y2SU62_ARAVE|nr:hypothetical protein AVEN_235978-1 [Araneus ventricosus]